MPDREKLIKAWEIFRDSNPYQICEGKEFRAFRDPEYCMGQMIADTIDLLKEQEKEIKALRLLVEWAEECDFGFDQFSDEYERYKDEIKDMKYIDGMIHIARRTLEDHGAFEERM